MCGGGGWNDRNTKKKPLNLLFIFFAHFLGSKTRPSQQLALCLRCIAMITNNPDIESLADAVDCLADLTYASVCACMLTQQQIQIQYRDSRARGGVVPGPMEAPTPPTMQPVARSGPRVVQPAQAQTTYVYTAPPPRPAPPIAQHHAPQHHAPQTVPHLAPQLAAQVLQLVPHNGCYTVGATHWAAHS